MFMAGQQPQSGGSVPAVRAARGKVVSPALRAKVISVGSAGCGKSSLIKRYCEERFVQKYVTTVGVDFGVKSVNVRGTEIKINFWDLAVHPDFYEIRNEFYKDTQGVSTHRAH